MEFERAIFRVYERCMDSILHEDDPANDVVYKKPCRMFELILAGLGTFLLFTLLLLHGVYVGNAGCLPQELMVFNSTTNTSSIRSFQDDEILLITIGNTMLRRSGSNLRIVDDDETNSNYERRRLQEYQFLDPSTTIQSLLSTYIYPLSNSSDHTFPSNITNHNNASTSSEVNKDWEYDYMVTFDYGVMLLDPDVKQSHHFTVVNVTLAGLECFGGETALNFLPLGGLDTAVLNNVMYSTNMSGQMISRRNDYYHWHTRDIYPNRNFGQWLGWKISIMLSSLFAFFLLSTTTALLVRVLISSGVVLVFPLFWCFQMFGMQAINLRLISLSYPWIGLPLQIIRARNQSMTPFIIAHLTRVVIYYLMYIGAQSLYIKLLYSDSTFGLDQIWLYAVMMLWEYYSMIYIRSSSSIMFFPKASLALFLIFHFYYYSFPAGFHLLALTVMFVFLMYLMIHCIRAFEIKAYRQGLVNIDQPRMLFVALPWPSWRADLAPDYTIFMPVTNRSGTVYQNQVPARPNTVPVPNGEGNVGEGAVAAHGQNGVEMTNVNPANNPTADNGISTNAPNSSSLPLSIFSSFFNTNYQSISIAGREGNATSNPVHSRNEYTSVSTESSHGESQRPTYNV